ncbi:3-hydroxyacyl-CoA dehydrogenase NAD-binding domain-containing protein, partial [Klebsiella pneumoniae]|uniref:3-hydroxyacyl-CoA dehydrogenase NAD-binding domain-containing protein n=1 Tax=Klebsiella pneumoniae TaxID=573 RepID=UPI0031B64BA8
MFVRRRMTNQKGGCKEQRGLESGMQTVGVIGAGQMGAGIAQVSAQAGFHVLLSDVSLERAAAGKAGIAKALDRLVT